jgi:APA family basic amino acid/polyamine antiporter
MVMSRDGLLPKSFGKIDKKYKTPGFSTIVTGLFVGTFVLFIDDKLMTDLTSIGTLFAFALVSGGVLVLPRIEKQKGKFSLPYINAKWIFPLLYLAHASSYLFEEGYQAILFLIFVLLSGVLAVFTFMKNFSLIPILGVSCCMYLMVEIPANSWMVFFAWMLLGLLIYFFYGKNKSKLNAV